MSFNVAEDDITSACTQLLSQLFEGLDNLSKLIVFDKLLKELKNQLPDTGETLFLLCYPYFNTREYQLEFVKVLKPFIRKESVSLGLINSYFKLLFELNTDIDLLKIEIEPFLDFKNIHENFINFCMEKEYYKEVVLYCKYGQKIGKIINYKK